MDTFQKTFFITCISFLILLVGCSGSDSDQNNQNLGNNNQNVEKKIVYKVQNTISSQALDNSRLKAYLTIDDEVRQKMALSQSGEGFEVAFQVQIGSHQFKIEFEYSEDDFGNTSIPLVSAVKEFTIKGGSNNELSYLESDYVHFDSDEDGISNLKEVTSKSDPFDPNSQPDITSATASAFPTNLSKIGSTQTIRVVFSESMTPETLTIDGSIAEQSDGGVWSKSKVDNDTLIFTPSTAWNGGVAQLKIDAKDLAGNPIDTLNLSYAIDTTPPESAVSPNNESVISASQTIVVTFNESMNSELFELTGTLAEYADGGSWSSRRINNDTLTINPKTQWPDGQQTLSIQGSDTADNPISAIDLTYGIDGSSATSKVEPQSGAIINQSQPITITFNKSIDTSTIQIAGSLAKEAEARVWSSGLIDNDTLWINPQIYWNAGPNTVVVEANDIHGNPIAPLELVYTVDATPPTATVVPANTLISNTQVIKLTFSETINTDTLIMGGSLFSSSDWGTLTSVKTSNDTLTFKPISNWGSGKQTLTVDARDMVGNAMEQFNIEFNVDNSKPIATITPTIHTTINGSQPIVYKFNESMLTSSLQLTGTMASQSKDPVWSTTNETNDTLTFSPVLVWQPGSQGVIISATDLVGNQSGLLLAGYNVDASSPTAVTDPQSGTSIIENQAIKIVFSETMDTNTLAFSGSQTMASASDLGSWSNTNVTNDTLILTPTEVWPQGEQNLEVTAKDLAGNLSTVVLSYKVLKQYDPNNYQLSGLLKFNGSAINSQTASLAHISIYDNSAKNWINAAEFEYYSDSGHYGIYGIPNKEIIIFLNIQVQGEDYNLPGNYYASHIVDISMLEQEETITHDIVMEKLIHLLTPYDNSKITLSSKEYPPHSSPIKFSWAPIEGAERYSVAIDNGYTVIHSYYLDDGSTSKEIILPISEPGEHYGFSVWAHKSDGTTVGHFRNLYIDNGYTTNYNFTVN